MSAVFWAWFLGLYAASMTGLFLVVAIGSHEVITELRDRIDDLKGSRDETPAPVRFVDHQRTASILDLIARNEAARFDPDTADWEA